MGGPGMSIPEVGEINQSAKGLFRLAQLTGNSSTLAPGACKRCGQVGHLYFNCRNYMLGKNSNQQPVEEEEEDLASEDLMSDSSEEDDSSDSSDDDSEESDEESSDEDESDEDSSS